MSGPIFSNNITHATHINPQDGTVTGPHDMQAQQPIWGIAGPQLFHSPTSPTARLRKPAVGNSTALRVPPRLTAKCQRLQPARPGLLNLEQYTFRFSGDVTRYAPINSQLPWIGTTRNEAPIMDPFDHALREVVNGEFRVDHRIGRQLFGYGRGTFRYRQPETAEPVDLPLYGDDRMIMRLIRSWHLFGQRAILTRLMVTRINHANHLLRVSGLQDRASKNLTSLELQMRMKLEEITGTAEDVLEDLGFDFEDVSRKSLTMTKSDTEFLNKKILKLRTRANQLLGALNYRGGEPTVAAVKRHEIPTTQDHIEVLLEAGAETRNVEYLIKLINILEIFVSELPEKKKTTTTYNFDGGMDYDGDVPTIDSDSYSDASYLELNNPPRGAALGQTIHFMLPAHIADYAHNASERDAQLLKTQALKVAPAKTQLRFFR